MRRKIQFTVTHCCKREYFFFVSEYILTVSPAILDRFSEIILLTNVYGLHLPTRFFAVAMAKITLYRLFFSFSNMWKKLTICDHIFPSVLRVIMNLVFKCQTCRTIQMNALDYKGLKSELIGNNKLEVSWTRKPPTTCTMHACRQRVFKMK